jgi:uncharacterized protein YgbK (DUF1537 family)
MPPVVTVIADDLTGACEIAGRGLAHGLKPVVSLDHYATAPDVDLVVIDSDSRLDAEGIAEAKVGEIASQIPASAHSRLFKKTDSVLRGSVHAEIAAMMRASTRRLALLVPANPELGRGISGGTYTIKGIPLDKTEFAEDPHHPLTNANVLNLLEGKSLQVRSAPSPERMEADGANLVVGDAMTVADLQAWATAVTPEILPAGSAAFFNALLDHWFPGSAKQQGKVSGESQFPGDGLTLLVSGTRSQSQRALLNHWEQAGGSTVSLNPDHLDPNALQAAARQVNDEFARTGKALVRVKDTSGSGRPTDPGKILAALAELTALLLERHQIAHVAIEGGATAAAICKRLGYFQLSVLHEWSPGTVLVKPLHDGCSPLFTVKPGSYPWPDAIHTSLFMNPSTSATT